METRRLLRKAGIRFSGFGLVLGAALFTPNAVLAQEPGSGVDCQREPWTYAVIIDASSSATRGDVRRSTADKYFAAVSLLSGMLCSRDQIIVLPVLRNDSVRWRAVDSVPPGATHQRLRAGIDRALQYDPDHSDLLLVTEHAQREVLTRPDLAAAFLLTDGSFYPYRVGPPDERLRTLRDRLSDLETIANQIIEQRIPFYVVGIGSHTNASAVDDDLPLTRRERKEDRHWLHRGTEYDLLTMSGDSLLKVLFRHHFVRVDSIDTWNLVMANPDGPWRARMGYTSGWSLPLRELRTLSIAHLVYRPEPKELAGAEPCALSDSVSGSRTVRRNGVTIRTAAGRFVCSIADPGSEEIEEVSSRAAQYIIRQKPLFHNMEGTGFLHGIYDYGIALGDLHCPSSYLRTLLEEAGQFPSSQPVARMEVLPRSTADTVRHLTLHQYANDCLHPSADAAAISGLHGRHLLRLTSAAGTWMEEREFVPPRMKVTSARFHPGGFPFPPDRYGVLRVCVSTREKVAPDRPLIIRLASRSHELESAAGCPDHTSESLPYRYQLNRLVPIDGGQDLIAVVSVSSDSTPGAWIHYEIKKTGYWSLAPRHLAIAIAIGIALQLCYLLLGAKVEFSEISFGRAVSILLSLLLSVVLVVVVVELVTVAWLEGLHNTFLPLWLVLLVLANALKLIAAILLPEIARDDLEP